MNEPSAPDITELGLTSGGGLWRHERVDDFFLECPSGGDCVASSQVRIGARGTGITSRGMG